MTPDDMTGGEAVSLPSAADIKLLWPQARGELLGFARHLAGRSPITASQMQMAVAMADAYAALLLVPPPEPPGGAAKFARGQWVLIPIHNDPLLRAGTVTGVGHPQDGEAHYIVLRGDGKESRYRESDLSPVTIIPQEIS